MKKIAKEIQALFIVLFAVWTLVGCSPVNKSEIKEYVNLKKSPYLELKDITVFNIDKQYDRDGAPNTKFEVKLKFDLLRNLYMVDGEEIDFRDRTTNIIFLSLKSKKGDSELHDGSGEIFYDYKHKKPAMSLHLSSATYGGNGKLKSEIEEYYNNKNTNAKSNSFKKLEFMVVDSPEYKGYKSKKYEAFKNAPTNFLGLWEGDYLNKGTYILYDTKSTFYSINKGKVSVKNKYTLSKDGLFDVYGTKDNFKIIELLDAKYTYLKFGKYNSFVKKISIAELDSFGAKLKNSIVGEWMQTSPQAKGTIGGFTIKENGTFISIEGRNVIKTGTWNIAGGHIIEFAYADKSNTLRFFLNKNNGNTIEGDDVVLTKIVDEANVDSDNAKVILANRYIGSMSQTLIATGVQYLISLSKKNSVLPDEELYKGKPSDVLVAKAMKYLMSSEKNGNIEANAALRKYIKYMGTMRTSGLSKLEILEQDKQIFIGLRNMGLSMASEYLAKNELDFKGYFKTYNSNFFKMPTTLGARMDFIINTESYILDAYSSNRLSASAFKNKITEIKNSLNSISSYYSKYEKMLKDEKKYGFDFSIIEDKDLRELSERLYSETPNFVNRVKKYIDIYDKIAVGKSRAVASTNASVSADFNEVIVSMGGSKDISSLRKINSSMNAQAKFKQSISQKFNSIERIPANKRVEYTKALLAECKQANADLERLKQSIIDCAEYENTDKALLENARKLYETNLKYYHSIEDSIKKSSPSLENIGNTIKGLFSF